MPSWQHRPEETLGRFVRGHGNRRAGSVKRHPRAGPFKQACQALRPIAPPQGVYHTAVRPGRAPIHSGGVGGGGASRGASLAPQARPRSRPALHLQVGREGAVCIGGANRRATQQLHSSYTTFVY